MVRIESEPGRGTTVRVFLPRVGGSSGRTTEFVVPPELRSSGDASGDGESASPA